MDQKAAIADRLKQANNILVTVSNNPSVDQLASCIALTLALNKLDKHATAVFSGNVPSTIEFLQPEKTLEKNTDSLRDFIISLDKAKADKLRYKVEDKVVKIFITPYRTSINQKDLEFSQGDFNVDVVLALGVHNQQDLDQAITSHGRILHDAVVATINVKPGGDLGTMNWLDTNGSSLSELATELIDAIDPKMIDEQMATALLTGIVAETDRFSNDRTTPSVMTISAELMGAGANQQLVATKLQEPLKPAPVAAPSDNHDEDKHDDEPPKADDGTLEINHPGQEGENLLEATPPPVESEPESEVASESNTPQIHIDEQGSLQSIKEQAPPLSALIPASEEKGSTDPVGHMGSSRMILQPPTLGGQLTGSDMSTGEDVEAPSGSPVGLPGSLPEPTFASPAPSPVPAAAPVPAPLPPSQPLAPLQAAPLTMPAPQPLPQPTIVSPTPPSVTPPPPMQFNAAPTAPAFAAPAPAQQVTPLPPVPPQSVMPLSVPVPPAVAPTPPTPLGPSPLPPTTPPSTQTLSEIEKDLDSPHAQAYTPPAMPPAAPPTPQPALPPVDALPPTPPEPSVQVQEPVPAAAPEEATAESIENARKAVMEAINSAPEPAHDAPIEALNAQPLGAPLHDPAADAAVPVPSVAAPADPLSPNPSIIEPTVVSPTGGTTPPPPMPPPMMPPAQGF